MTLLSDLRASGRASVTIKDVADLMGVDRRTVTDNLSVNGGAIPSLRIGRRIVIPTEQLLRFFDGSGNEQHAADPPGGRASDAQVVERDALIARMLRSLLEEVERGKDSHAAA